MKYAFSLLFGLGLCCCIRCKPVSRFDVNPKMLRAIPDSVLHIDSMAAVMVDIQLAEAWSGLGKSDSIAPAVKLNAWYADVFSAHHIDQEMYMRSYRYYVNNPALMDYIYQEVTNKLNLLESEYGSMPGQKEKRK